MKEHKVKIRIVPANSSSNDLSTRSAFWEYISSQTKRESDSPERLEHTFKKGFTRDLKEALSKKFQDKLRDFKRYNDVDFRSLFWDEYFHRFSKRIESDEKVYFDDFVNNIVKIQELQNNYFKDNSEYQDLLTKNILAAKVDFGIENIAYSSLGFDLNVEPFDKVAQLFDNNYELFRIFLDQYIPESFLSSLSIYDDSIPISVSIEYPQNFRSEFENRANINETTTLNNPNKNQPQSKWDKAKWTWILTNTSLVVPVILALVVFYVAFNKFESMEKLRQDNQKEINLERDNLIKNYQEIISFQKSSYQDLIKVIEKDTLK